MRTIDEQWFDRQFDARMADLRDLKVQLAEKDAELLALRAALRALVARWNDFAFKGDEHYVPQGDGYIASACADELEHALAASPPHPETEQRIDNGNSFVFCDAVQTTKGQSLCCVRGAGHSGPHAFVLPPIPLSPGHIGVPQHRLGTSRDRRAVMPEKNPWTLQSLGSYLGWANNQSDEQIWRFAAERERVLRVAQAMLETKKSDAPTAEAAIRDRITALRAPAPQEPT